MADNGSAGVLFGGGGGGGSAGVLFNGGGGGAPAPAGQPRKVASPEDNLTNSLIRLAKTYKNVGGGDQQRILQTIHEQSAGLKGGQRDKIGAALTFQGGVAGPIANRAVNHQAPGLAGALQSVGDTGGSVLGKTLDYLGRPAQAVQSTVAEAAREGGWQHADLGKLITAGKEGLEGKRHDTISSIVQENTGYKLKGVGRFAADLGGGIALDPLTYTTFGLSDAAKVGLRSTAEALGAGRAAEVAQKGAGILSAEEKIRLGKSVVDSLKGVRGGLKVHAPTFSEKTIPFTNVPRLSVAREGRTLIPGPFAARKAGKIIEGQGAHLDEAARARLAQIGTEGEHIVTKANELDAQAAHIEAAGQDASALRSQIAELDGRATVLAREAENVQRGVVTGAAAAARTLDAAPLSRFAAKVSDSPIANTLRGIFIPRGNVAHKFGEAAAAKLDDARILYRGEYQSSVEDHVAQLLHAAKESGVTNDELTHIIGPALDIGGDASKVPEHLQPMYQALADVRDRFTQSQIQAGVAHEEALHITDEYFPRYLTQEARKVITGKERANVIPPVPGEATLTRAPSGQLRKREANIDQPISEINPEFQAEHGVKKFEDNPLTAISRRAVEAEQDVATKHYVDRVLKLRDDSGNRLFYTADEVMRDRLTLPKDWVEEKVPGVGVVHAPKEIIGEVKKAQELLVNDQHLNALIKGLDKWMTLWKGYATVPLPFGLGFHERNAIGNVFLNWLAGISPGSGAYARAARIQRNVTKGRKAGDVLKFLTGEDRRIVDQARKHDIIGEGFYGFDLPKNQDVAVHVPFKQATGAEKARRVRSAANPLNPSNALISSGRKFGSAIEENARLAHFIEMEHRYGGNAAEAARSVRKYLFDYSDLTATERQVFKRSMAFYTFTRKNLPVQVGALLRTPGKFSHLQTARKSVADTAQQPKGLYPSYLPELGGTPLPIDISRGLSKVPGLGVDPKQQLVFAPDLPLINATSSVSPAIQLLASLPGVNKIPGLPHNPQGAPGAFRDLATQTFSGGAPGAISAAYQALGAEKDFFSGRPLNGRVAAPAYSLLPGLNQERVLNGQKQPTITAKGQYLAESLFPLLGKVSSFAPQGAYEQEKAPRRRLSTFTGLRVYPLGPGTSRGEALRRNAQVAALIADLKARGIDIPSSREKKKKGLMP